MFAQNKAYLSVWNNVSDEVKQITFAVSRFDVKSGAPFVEEKLKQKTVDTPAEAEPSNPKTADAGTLPFIALVALCGAAMHMRNKNRK